MNNTSAYANVLLKSPVVAPAAAATKRDYQSEDSSADFHKTLKDVNEDLKNQDVQTRKSADNKKSMQADRQKDRAEAKESQDIKAAENKAAQKKSATEPADVKQRSSDDQTLAREPSVDKENKKNVVGKKTADTQADDEVNQAAVYLDANTGLPAQDTVLAAMSVAAPVTSSNISTSTDADLSSETASSIDSLDSTAQLTSSIATLSGLNAAAASIDVSEKLVGIQASTTGEDVGLTADPAIDPAAQPLAPILASAKASEPQVAIADVPEDAAEILASLTTDVSSKPAQTNTSPADAKTATNNPELTTAQTQIQASKSAFEKTLQAIVTPESTAGDDSTAPASSTSNSSSSSNQLMDSFMRATDSQTPAARSFVVQTAVPVPVGQPQWSQAVGEKVLWLAAQNVSSAEINLHPKDLGPIQVKVSLNQEQATVSFTSHHAVVREVLDQNLTRLRDMFSEQGLNLVNVDVSDKSFSRQQGDAQAQKGQGGSQDVLQEDETPIAMSAIVQQRLVDHYA